MEPMIRHKLFSYIDEHINIYQEQWQHLQTLIERAPDASIQQSQAMMLITYLRQSGICSQVLDLPQTAIYGLYSGENPQTLLLYLPIYRSRRLEPLICSLAAIEAYQATTGQLPISIKWLLDFGEGRQLAELVASDRALLQANGCLWYNEEQTRAAGPLFALGTKGKLGVELKACTSCDSPPTAHAGVLPNALWRLLWAVNSLKNAHEEILIEGFYDTLRPLADDLTTTLYELGDNAQLFARHWGLETPLLGLQGLQFHYAHLLTPTCTISNVTDNAQISPTGTGTTIPTQATAQLEFLLVPEQDPHDIFDKLLSHLRSQGFPDIQAHLLHTDRAIFIGPAHPFVEAVSQSSRSLYGHPPYLLPLSAGSYPLAPLSLTLGIPVLLDLMSKPGRGADSSSEAQQMAQQIKQLIMIMDRCTLL